MQLSTFLSQYSYSLAIVKSLMFLQIITKTVEYIYDYQILVIDYFILPFSEQTSKTPFR